MGTNSSALAIKHKNHQYKGFIDLIKEIAEIVKPLYFEVESNALAKQDNIQTLSYTFAEICFGGSFGRTNQGKQMQMYLAKIDIDEINIGCIDLSSPNLHQKKYSNDEIERIFEQNEYALNYLKNPFSTDLNNQSLTEEIDNFYNKINKIGDDQQIVCINDFLNSHKNKLNEVILFSEILGLICSSQSLFAFAYQIKVNSNFAKITELALKCSLEVKGLEHIQRLAERFFTIFIGNLAARVFSNQTLQTIEQAFSIKEKQ